jgi:hypothetical protein
MSSVLPADSHDAGVPRAATAFLGFAGAVLIGGVAQAFVWRWDIDWLTAVSSSQFLWGLLCFYVAWGWSRGRLLPGVAAGATTGLGLIASYYVVQWLVDGRHAALDQFTESRGLAWTAASVIGGAGVGLLGALAAAPATTHPRRKAFGLVGTALIVAGGPAAWWISRGDQLRPDGSAISVATFVCVGAALLATALWRCGPGDTIRGGVPAVLLATVVLAMLYVLEPRLLYLTF